LIDDLGRRVARARSDTDATAVHQTRQPKTLVVEADLAVARGRLRRLMLHNSAMLSVVALAITFALPDLPEYARPAYRLATPEVREAIDDAYAEVDPTGRFPWWRVELYLICARESRCGRDGLTSVHEGDAWAGESAWRKAVDAGQLDLDGCPEHAFAEGEWGTRGLFGMNAARSIGKLGGCRGPEAMDEPRMAASLAVQELASCRTWVGLDGARRRIRCTCIDHTRLWIGAGAWARRPLLGQRSRLVSVARQCGPEVAAWMFVVEFGLAF
jgi:hypothetical protein